MRQAGGGEDGKQYIKEGGRDQSGELRRVVRRNLEAKTGMLALEDNYRSYVTF